MAAFDLILFDVDGTLVDSQRTIIACMEAAFIRYELPIPSAAAIRHTVGLALVDGVAQLLAAKDAALKLRAHWPASRALFCWMSHLPA